MHIIIYNVILLKVYGYGDIKALMEKDENVIYLSNHQCTGKYNYLSNTEVQVNVIYFHGSQLTGKYMSFCDILVNVHFVDYFSNHRAKPKTIKLVFVASPLSK